MTPIGDSLRPYVEELNRRRQARIAAAARELAERRAAFTGDCSWCFDEGVCVHCPRGRYIADVQAQAERDRAAEEWRQRRAEVLHYAHVPPRHFQCGLESFPAPKLDAYRAVVEWLASWDGDRSLILSGQVGRGKTGLMVGVMRELAAPFAEHGYTMLFQSSVDLMDALRAGYDDHQFDERMERLRTVRLLAIDDLGTENPTDWVRERLYSVINARYEYHRPLLITTNYTMDGLTPRLGERTVDRLRDMCDLVTVKGDNLRQQQREGKRR